jgi:hypothetical protein
MQQPAASVAAQLGQPHLAVLHVVASCQSSRACCLRHTGHTCSEFHWLHLRHLVDLNWVDEVIVGLLAQAVLLMRGPHCPGYGLS